MTKRPTTHMLRTGRTILPYWMRNFIQKMTANRQYKDELFKFIFKDKEKLLQLYNALNHSHYSNAEDLTIITRQNVIFLQMKEDLSFLISDVLNLYEQQSTWNPNMPIRGLLYLADQYDDIIRRQKLNIYGSRLVPLPTPQFFVFYNGQDKDMGERMELHLSDSFIQKNHQPAVEVIATVLNINYSHNQELLDQCKPLRDYSIFINKIRECIKAGYSNQEAFYLTVTYCKENDILADILAESEAKVESYVLTHFNMKDYLKDVKKEGEEALLKRQISVKLIRGLSEEQIAADLETDIETVQKFLQEIRLSE